MLNKKYLKTKDVCDVTFEVAVEEAEKAVLVCDVNGWEPIQMTKTRKGPFQTKVRFPKGGRFEFRYRVDGERWLNDEAADGVAPNEFGEQNSVVETNEPAAK